MVICNANCKTDSVMLPKGGVTEPVIYEENDDAVIGRLCVMAEDYDLQGNGGRRLECCLVLEEMSSLWLLWTRGIPDRLSHKADIMATTPDDLLAKSLLVRLPGIDNHFPALDRAPVLYTVWRIAADRSHGGKCRLGGPLPQLHKGHQPENQNHYR